MKRLVNLLLLGCSTAAFNLHDGLMSASRAAAPGNDLRPRAGEQAVPMTLTGRVVTHSPGPSGSCLIIEATRSGAALRTERFLACPTGPVDPVLLSPGSKLSVRGVAMLPAVRSDDGRVERLIPMRAEEFAPAGSALRAQAVRPVSTSWISNRTSSQQTRTLAPALAGPPFSVVRVASDPWGPRVSTAQSSVLDRSFGSRWRDVSFWGPTWRDSFWAPSTFAFRYGGPLWWGPPSWYDPFWGPSTFSFSFGFGSAYPWGWGSPWGFWGAPIVHSPVFIVQQPVTAPAPAPIPAAATETAAAATDAAAPPAPAAEAEAAPFPVPGLVNAPLVGIPDSGSNAERDNVGATPASDVAAIDGQAAPEPLTDGADTPGPGIATVETGGGFFPGLPEVSSELPTDSPAGTDIGNVEIAEQGFSSDAMGGMDPGGGDFGGGDFGGGDFGGGDLGGGDFGGGGEF